MPITILTLSPQATTTRLDQLVSAYEAIYGMPSGAGRGFATQLVEHSQRAGFQLCAAVGEASTEFIGFGYSFTGWPGQAWRDSLAAAMGADIGPQWLTGHFEFAEFGVLPAMRQRGVGAGLYQQLFRHLPHQRAILTVRKENQIAQRFYAQRNWQTLYAEFFTPSGRGPYLVMGRELVTGVTRAS